MQNSAPDPAHSLLVVSYNLSFSEMLSSNTVGDHGSVRPCSWSHSKAVTQDTAQCGSSSFMSIKGSCGWLAALSALSNMVMASMTWFTARRWSSMMEICRWSACMRRRLAYSLLARLFSGMRRGLRLLVPLFELRWAESRWTFWSFLFKLFEFRKIDTNDPSIELEDVRSKGCPLLDLANAAARSMNELLCKLLQSLSPFLNSLHNTFNTVTIMHICKSITPDKHFATFNLVCSRNQ